jgi:membrane-bound lytic murein transglycosylase D
MNTINRGLIVLLLSSLILTGCSIAPEKQPEALQTNSDTEQPDELAVILPAETTTTSGNVIEVTSNEAEFSPQLVDDLWERISGQLVFAHSDNGRVKRRIAWYMRHPNYMHIISDRAEPFLYYLVTEVERRNLPIELALMPLIESDFNTQAYSPRHASGLWQLTPHIAKHFGARINAWYDGRQDIVDSTQAALDFLEYLHKRFDGDWYHTIAAYNTGEGRVLNAIKKNKQKGLSTDFFSLQLPKETRHFVPKLLAVTQILKNKLMDFPAIDNEPVIRLVPWDKPAVLPNSDNWKDIDRLNPGYTRFPALLEGGSHIVVPSKRLSEWHKMMAQLPALSADTWQQIKIRPGDTLSGIAFRYSLTVAQLKTFNQLDGDKIRAGKTLLLPLLADKQIDYTVKEGDNLWLIARRFDTTVLKLKQWNSLSSNILQIGRTLNIFLNRT